MGIRWMTIPVVVVAVAASALTVGCSSVTPSAGEEAVLVRQPWFFGHGGVDDQPVRTGRVWVAPTTHAVIVNMQPQAFNRDFDDMNSRDGIPLDFHAQLRLQVTDSVAMVKGFGDTLKAVYDRNLDKPFESTVRQAVRRHAESDIAVTAVDEIDAEVEKIMREIIVAEKLPVRLLDGTVGKANPPTDIQAQRIATATQRQRQATEDLRKLAEDKRKAAEESRAAADKAYNQTMGIDTQQYVALQQLQMLREVCGKGTCTFLMGTGGTPLINMGAR
jgi:regulator of protease activity HflC (stomatin/prohibitin superfamily)